MHRLLTSLMGYGTKEYHDAFTRDECPSVNGVRDLRRIANGRLTIDSSPLKQFEDVDEEAPGESLFLCP